MKSKSALFIIIIVSFTASVLGKMLLRGPREKQKHSGMFSGPKLPSTGCKRIVSLAPSLTEVLFALGLDHRIHGVTRYCDYPPQARSKKKIGGYYDPNYEAIAALKPDLVVTLPEHGSAPHHLSQLGLSVVAVNHDRIPEILLSIKTIGSVCHIDQMAQRLASNLEGRMNHVKKKTMGLFQPRVMIVVGRDITSGTIKDAFVAGRNTFYDEMIALAGGTNAYQGQAVQFPVLSTEGIFHLNPQVIVDMTPNPHPSPGEEERVLSAWKKIKATDAVKNNRVHVFAPGYVARPGPRFVLILEALARMLHPEAVNSY